ncbi:hypothetical protein LI177_05195 [bacterium 210820-DFI.6.37]|nr:hypothetical protein [bacterium 210820-DFI.6.37]
MTILERIKKHDRLHLDAIKLRVEQNKVKDYIIESGSNGAADGNDVDWIYIALNKGLVLLVGETTITPTEALTATTKIVNLPIALSNKRVFISSIGRDQIATLNLGAYASGSTGDKIEVHIFASNTTTRRVSLCVVGNKI